MRTALLLLLAACDSTSRVAVTGGEKRSLPTVAADNGKQPPSCEPEGSTPPAPENAGWIDVAQAKGHTHSLYWVRLPAKARPARGTLFYLAGGPISHINYMQLAAAFQKTAYPQFDVVLYDYYGFNCSSALQDVAKLDAQAPSLTMTAMAADFVQLKRKLLGTERAYVMGGSHGAMLGAQIVADYADDIARAILFSGDPGSAWLAEGWFRFDALVAGLAAHDATFATNLKALFDRATRGVLAIDVDGKRHVLTRAELEISLWLAGGLSSAVQTALPEIVKASLDGNLVALSRFYQAELELLEPVRPTPSPTEVSVVTNFYRCNVWFAKSARASASLATRHTTYFQYASFSTYWSELCKDYDHLGEFPYRAIPPKPTPVPVLAWLGDHDTFDPEGTRARFEQLSSKLTFEVMPEWGHDFGNDETAGFLTVVAKIKRFLE